MREQLGATGGLERSVAREVIEREREDGVYIELSHGVDDVDEQISCPGSSDMRSGRGSRKNVQ